MDPSAAEGHGWYCWFQGHDEEKQDNCGWYTMQEEENSRNCNVPKLEEGKPLTWLWCWCSLELVIFRAKTTPTSWGTHHDITLRLPHVKIWGSFCSIVGEKIDWLGGGHPIHLERKPIKKSGMKVPRSKKCISLVERNSFVWAPLEDFSSLLHVGRRLFFIWTRPHRWRPWCSVHGANLVTSLLELSQQVSREF